MLIQENSLACAGSQRALISGRYVADGEIEKRSIKFPVWFNIDFRSLLPSEYAYLRFWIM